MPRKNRSVTMDPSEPGTYHIWSRCVRRAFLCGKDKRTGKDYSHRRTWLEERVRKLAALFAIDVTFVAVLANQFHLVLSNLPDLVERWSDNEVMRRSCAIFPWKFWDLLRVIDGRPTKEQLATLVANRPLVAEMRVRLSDPSWLLRQLKQWLAVASNREDECRGHFFEAPFDHNNVTDEAGLLICGLYVDLKQIAAREAETPEESLHTSAGMRTAARLLRDEGRHDQAAAMDGFLAPINAHGDDQPYPAAGALGSLRASDRGRLELTLDDYLTTLDLVGRLKRPGKAGAIPEHLPPILERLGLTVDTLTAYVEGYEFLFRRAVGMPASLREFTNRLAQRWIQGIRAVMGVAAGDAGTGQDAQ